MRKVNFNWTKCVCYNCEYNNSSSAPSSLTNDDVQTPNSFGRAIFHVFSVSVAVVHRRCGPTIVNNKMVHGLYLSISVRTGNRGDYYRYESKERECSAGGVRRALTPHQ